MNTGNGIFSKILGWLPDWLGFPVIIAAGGTMLVVGALQPSAGLIAFGVATIASAILAWIAGAVSRPSVDPIGKSFGGRVDRIPMVPWLIIFGLFVVATIIALVAK